MKYKSELKEIKYSKGFSAPKDKWCDILIEVSYNTTITNNQVNKIMIYQGPDNEIAQSIREELGL